MWSWAELLRFAPYSVNFNPEKNSRLNLKSEVRRIWSPLLTFTFMMDKFWADEDSNSPRKLLMKGFKSLPFHSDEVHSLWSLCSDSYAMHQLSCNILLSRSNEMKTESIYGNSSCFFNASIRTQKRHVLFNHIAVFISNVPSDWVQFYTNDFSECVL